VRGAITVAHNERSEIVEATYELLSRVVEVNGIEAEDIAGAIFTMTHDLDAEYPAVAARRLGWTQCALMCSQEIPVPGSLSQCIRVMLFWNTEKAQAEIRHTYLKGAARLRPDLAAPAETTNG
jgi:chorismate mutase